MVPESIALEEGNLSHDFICFTGNGYFGLKKLITSRKFVEVYNISSALMFGIECASFGTPPTYQLESKCYSSIGVLSQDDFNTMLLRNKTLEIDVENHVLDNPYDIERDFFCNICKTRI